MYVKDSPLYYWLLKCVKKKIVKTFVFRISDLLYFCFSKAVMKDIFSTAPSRFYTLTFSLAREAAD